MKSFAEILKLAVRGDYPMVAQLAGCSSKNVELIVKGQRPDNYNVQQIFSQVIAQRKELVRTTRKLKREGAYKGDEGATMGMAY